LNVDIRTWYNPSQTFLYRITVHFVLRVFTIH
jgi:hypothetical protein